MSSTNEYLEVPGGNTKTPGTTERPSAASTKSTKQDSAKYRWFFTLKAESLSPDKLWKSLDEVCKDFHFQLEEGDGGYLHYQGCFSLTTRERLSSLKNHLGYNNIHLEPSMDWHASVAYCTKQDTRKLGPWNKKNRPVQTISIETFHPWQKDLYEHLQGNPDPRKIIWYHDPVGNSGKTAFAKFCAVNLGALVLNNAKTADIAHCVDSPKIVILNLTRTMEGHINYAALESLKDGLIFSSKYDSKMKIFDPPHVVVMSNFMPNLFSMSEDRWYIVNMGIA